MKGSGYQVDARLAAALRASTGQLDRSSLSDERRRGTGLHRQPKRAEPARLVEAVARGEIDTAVVWGPLAGYFASRQTPPLRVSGC